MWFAGQSAALGFEGLVQVNQAFASTSQQPGISLFRLPTITLRGVRILGVKAFCSRISAFNMDMKLLVNMSCALFVLYIVCSRIS